MIASSKLRNILEMPEVYSGFISSSQNWLQLNPPFTVYLFGAESLLLMQRVCKPLISILDIVKSSYV